MRIRGVYLVLYFIVSIVMIWHNSISYAQEKYQTIYTIQIASHKDVSTARIEFERLKKKLKEADLNYLRVEEIGKFYSVRLGKFKDRAGAEKLSKSIKPQIPSHMVIDAYFIEKRVVEMHEPIKSAEKPVSKEETLKESLSREIPGEKAAPQKVIPPVVTRKSFGKTDKRKGSSAVKLKTKIPELCFKCHKELEKGLSNRYVHFLFKQGKCITCHNSHASKVKGLMIEEIDDICLSCHEEIRNLIRKTIIHSALRDNECTECHYAHSGENKHLLVDKEKDLCLKCHENINEQFRASYFCLPFKEGNCSSCHNSHASSEDDLLFAVPNKLCKECHGPRCNVKKVSLVSIVDNSDCTTCHTGHSAMEKGLLGPYGHKAFLDKKCEECHGPISAGGAITTKLENEELCFNCHKRDMSKYTYVDNDIHVKDAKNPCTVCHDYHASDRKNLTMKESRLCAKCHEATETRTAAMEKALTSIKCAPVRERKCFECHIPTHSDRPLNYREDEIPMCGRCHASQHKITHPLGNDVIDTRSGRPITCNSCHSMHSANADFMLTHDRKRALCIQCHKM